jgi:hypothetical protein
MSMPKARRLRRPRPASSPSACSIQILIAASLVALTGGASAGPLEAQVGAALVAFDQGHSDDATTIGAGTLTATLHVDPRVPVGLQMHLAVGRDGTGTRALGIIVRRPWGVGSDFGVGIASVTGVGNDMAPSLRPGGIGVSVDARSPRAGRPGVAFRWAPSPLASMRDTRGCLPVMHPRAKALCTARRRRASVSATHHSRAQGIVVMTRDRLRATVRTSR